MRILIHTSFTWFTTCQECLLTPLFEELGNQHNYSNFYSLFPKHVSNIVVFKWPLFIRFKFWNYNFYSCLCFSTKCVLSSRQPFSSSFLNPLLDDWGLVSQYFSKRSSISFKVEGSQKLFFWVLKIENHSPFYLSDSVKCRILASHLTSLQLLIVTHCLPELTFLLVWFDL